MIYEISSKTDLAAGVLLTVRIPESELDHKALYTMLAEKPHFTLPLHYKSTGGQAELVYRVGTRSKLQYISGSRSPSEYAELWLSVLTPLLECGDWFMKPYSFVLQAAHLYYDKHSKAVSYLYIPSRRDCSDHDDLTEMAAELTRYIYVTDANLENKVLRAIMKDFDPNELLRLLKPYHSASIPGAAELTESAAQFVAAPAQAAGQNPPASSGDIVINIAEAARPAKKTAEKSAGTGSEKKGLAAKKQKPGGGLFGKNKKEPRAIMPADAAPLPEPERARPAIPGVAAPAGFADITQLLDNALTSGAKLRFTGQGFLPEEIHLPEEKEEVFTIGRFDVSIGRRQSDFEFDKNTPAVSRRHAVIERDAGGYSITDLASSAGTFVDGVKLPPNIPRRLQHGQRVSFGNAGADYIWEE